MNYVKKIEFEESFEVKDENYKATADDVRRDIDTYFSNAEKYGKQDKILWSLTGNGGTGKTAFLKRFLMPSLEEDYSVHYCSILNVLDSYEPGQPDLKETLYSRVVQESRHKGLKFLSSKMNVLSVVMTFVIGTLWTVWSTLISQYNHFSNNPIFQNAGMDVFFGIALLLSLGYIALLVYTFWFAKNVENTKIGVKLKKAKHNYDKKNIYIIDDLSRIPEELEKEIMVKLASMRDFAHNEVDSIFFLVNSNKLIIDNDEEDDFINKFVYEIYDMQFGEDLIISIFTNRVSKPTEQDMKILNSIGNLRDLNAYIVRLKDNLTDDVSTITKTTDREVKAHMLKHLAKLQREKFEADKELAIQTKEELAQRKAAEKKASKAQNKTDKTNAKAIEKENKENNKTK